MTKKLAALALAIGTLTLVYLAGAQQANKVNRIVYLSPSFATVNSSNLKIFQQGLREVGYVEGKNIVIDYRYAEGKFERLPHFAAELVRLRVDLLVTVGGTPAALAAKNATTTGPIVFTAVGDPVTSGLVASLARPGGNITGLTILTPELSGKRLELLKEAFPKISLVAVLWNPSNPASKLFLRETEVAAEALGLRLQSLEVRGADDFRGAFQAATKRGAGALIALTDPLISGYQTRIIELAAKSRLPTIFDPREFAEGGGLMSYGPDRSEMYRRAAVYVDKILKGAKPADLPVEQPTKFELVINLKTAKQIGLTIPPNVLARADKVIR
jgi:putative ABC transport system substrate-binding protein